MCVHVLVLASTWFWDVCARRSGSAWASPSPPPTTKFIIYFLSLEASALLLLGTLAAVRAGLYFLFIRPRDWAAVSPPPPLPLPHITSCLHPATHIYIHTFHLPCPSQERKEKDRPGREREREKEREREREKRERESQRGSRRQQKATTVDARRSPPPPLRPFVLFPFPVTPFPPPFAIQIQLPEAPPPSSRPCRRNRILPTPPRPP